MKIIHLGIIKEEKSEISWETPSGSFYYVVDPRVFHYYNLLSHICNMFIYHNAKYF